MNDFHSLSLQHHKQVFRRPRGLWKARAGPRLPAAEKVPDRQANAPRPFPIASLDTDDDDSDLARSNTHSRSLPIQSANDSDSSSSSKRRRKSPGSDTPLSSEDEDAWYWDFSRHCNSRQQYSNKKWSTRAKIMDTSSTAIPSGLSRSDPTPCTVEDWEDLKELFAKATEHYESDDASETLPLLRGIIHECHRFLRLYEDPSVVFFTPPSTASPRAQTPPQERIKRDWEQYDNPYHKMRFNSAKGKSNQKIVPPVPTRPERKYTELPTAFHALLGTTLLFFGNLIAQEPSFALEGEPSNPMTYWLAALDVFEMGDSLPSKTRGILRDAPEDWRMQIAWGRTLLCIADEMLTKTKQNPSDPTSAIASLFEEDVQWSSESPFDTITKRRPPVTRRLSFASFTVNELMKLAMDHFSSGIFYMPHPERRHTLLSNLASQSNAAQPQSSSSVPPTPAEPISRAKELYTIASEMLLVAEKLSKASEREYWGAWADSIFGQIRVGDASSDTGLARVRGRCWLVVGAARAEELESSLEKGDLAILESEEAEDARDALRRAITYLERAKVHGGETNDGATNKQTQREASPDEELSPLLTEALVTLANLTADEHKREDLYAQAQKEGGDALDLDMDEDGDGDDEMEVTD